MNLHSEKDSSMHSSEESLENCNRNVQPFFPCINPTIDIKTNHETIVNNFIKYYYEQFNNKTMHNLLSLYNQYSEIRFNHKSIIGPVAINEFHLNVMATIVKFNEVTYDYQKCGSRRLNILIRGCFLANNRMIRFSEFIHLAATKYTFWIPSSIFNFDS